MLAEFPELKTKPNACTRPNCFAQKCKAYWLSKSEDLKRVGKTVLTTGEFNKVKGEYIDATREGWGLFENDYDSPKKVLGKHAPEPVMVATPDGLKTFYKRADMAGAAKKAGVKLSGGSNRAETTEQKAKREATAREENAMFTRRIEFAKTLIPRLAAAADKTKDSAAWQLLAKRVEKHSWEKERTKLLDAVKSDKSRVLIAGLWSCLRGRIQGGRAGEGYGRVLEIVGR